MTQLVLYTRRGCCLCEGLAERLNALDPPARFAAVDVDADPALQARFGLEVPLLSLRGANTSERLLPRVPPRLAGAGLQVWLQKQGFPAPSA